MMLDVRDYLRADIFFLGKLHLFVVDTEGTADDKNQTYHHIATNILTVQPNQKTSLKHPQTH